MTVVDLGRPVGRSVLEAASREQLMDALEHAIQIIESYQFDIRHSEDRIAVNLVDLGFCEGAIYRDALPRVRRLLGASVAADG